MEKRRGRPRKQSPIQEEISSNQSNMENIEDAKFEFVADSNSGSFNPLADEVIEREYSKANIADGVTEDLEEPKFNSQSYDDVMGNNSEPQNNGSGQPQFQSSNNANSGTANQKIQQDPLSNINSGYNELDDKQKKQSSEQLVDMILDGFEFTHQFAIKNAQVDDDELRGLIIQEKINPNRQIPISDRQSVGVQEFFAEFNNQVADGLSPDPAFRKKIKPPLVRIFQKRGYGLTDEQYVLGLGIQYVITKGMMWSAFKKTSRSILNMLQDEIESAKVEQELREQAPIRPTPPENNNVKQPIYEPVIIEDIDEPDVEQYEPIYQDDNVQSFNINNEDNPLRQNKQDRDLSKNVKVEETFTKGGIIDNNQ
jgi:hypothetical protein